jgi:hypothetical protein
VGGRCWIAHFPFDRVSADEGGVSAWIPGFFGSMAATPWRPVRNWPRSTITRQSRRESRIFRVGPQIGYSFPIGGALGYLNLKGYYEFSAENRSEGWNTWLTFALSPLPPHAGPVK